MKILRTRTKIEAGMACLFLILISIVSVYATVLNTDKETTTTDSSLKLNYTEGWANLVNLTVENNITANNFIGSGWGHFVNISVDTTVEAGSFVGDGSGLINLPSQITATVGTCTIAAGD